MTKVVIIGGGPGGYEAALVAAQLGANVTLIERDGIGGAAVLTDVVPSKALIAVAEAATDTKGSSVIGVHATNVSIDIAEVNARLKKWAATQSADIQERLLNQGIKVLAGTAELVDAENVKVILQDRTEINLAAEVVLLATGARPRELASAVIDGQRILNWKQLYEFTELPTDLIVVGSGVTGAEFAGAYQALGSQVTLVSSRDQVLPGKDSDAAKVVQDVFAKRGMKVLSQSRAIQVTRSDSGVEVELETGEIVSGSHCLMAVGSLPNTEALGLENVGVKTNDAGFIDVDKVSRTSVRGVYAAGDCTGVMMLASVAAMQGRIAMWHALGDAVHPLNLETVSSNVFTDPEIATVGVSQSDLDSGNEIASVVNLPLATNARAKMQGISEGFVKIFCRSDTGVIIGGVVVAPKASELIFPIALAVEHRLTVDQMSQTITVYPSLSGSIAEAARQLHQTQNLN
ncbi:MAG: NAD(P)H-quinone dehydrogenase [Actinobacteria bacterium]|nr:NAD(P)H-quinone dehydrogenase [Actinomycetota bacterium]